MIRPSSAIKDRIKLASPILLRYGLYSFAIFESLLLPVYLTGENYVQFEYYKNLTFIFPYFLLGAHSGFTLLHYTYSITYYKQLFSVSIVVITLFSILFSFFFQNSILLLPLGTIGLYTIVEQFLKINKQFFNIFIFKPLLSIITICLAFLYLTFHNKEIPFSLLFILSFGISCMIWVILIPTKGKYLPVDSILNISKITLMRYLVMSKVFFSGVLLSLTLYGLFFFQRYYITHFYPKIAETYSFSFNLSQILVIILTGISYVTSVHLGEKLSSVNYPKLKKQFLKSVALYTLVFILFILFSYFISLQYTRFKDLVKTVTLISFFKGFFFLVATISPLATYNGYNTLLFKYLLTLSLINILCIGIYIYLNIDVFYLLAFDGIILFIYSFLILRVIFTRIGSGTKKSII